MIFSRIIKIILLSIILLQNILNLHFDFVRIIYSRITKIILLSIILL